LEPDIVILPLGTFSFTVGLVWLRVEATLGKRAAAWYRKVEALVDRRTRSNGRLGRANLALKRAARRTLGVRPLASMDATLAGYRAVLDGLAADERVQVVLVAYPPESANTRRTAMRERGVFLSELRHDARERHFGWASCEEAVEAVAGTAHLVTPDGFHMSDQGHEVLGRLVLEAVLNAVEPALDPA
jgi:hypothetical protein